MTAPTFYQATGGPVPKIEIEIYLRNTGAPPSGNRDIWILAERAVAGTSAANEVKTTPFGSEAEAIAWFGAGSPGAQMAAYIFGYNHPTIGRPKGGVYGMAVAASGAASGAVTQTFATNASASGQWIFEIAGHILTVPVDALATPTVQGDSVVKAWADLELRFKCPLTPVNAAGTVTWTYNVTGAAGNGLVCSTLQDPGVTTTCVWGASGVTAGGTAGYPVLTTVLANAASTRTKVLICPWDDFTNTTGEIELLVDHINTKSNAPNMLGSQLICADIDTPTNLVTNAGVLDDSDGQRVCLVGRRGAHEWIGEIAAKVAAAYAAEPNLGRSHDGIDVDMYPASRANAFTEPEQTTMLNGGVSPLNTPTGMSSCYITRLVSVRDAYGVMDFALMSVLDYVRDVLHARLAADYDRASMVETEDIATTAEHVKTPEMFRESCRVAFKYCEEEGLIYNVDDDFKNVDVTLDLVAGTVKVALPVKMVKQIHNYMVRLDSGV
jgi:phage tail sheath gpL-like